MFTIDSPRDPTPKCGTVCAVSEEFRIAQVLRDRAASQPEHVALVDGDGRTETYAELDDRSNRLANHLLALGVNAGRPGRAPGPQRARGRRAAAGRGQGRGGDRAAQLAAGPARAGGPASTTPARSCCSTARRSPTPRSALLPDRPDRPARHRQRRPGPTTRRRGPASGRRLRRGRAAAVHVRDDRAAQGRADDQPQPLQPDRRPGGVLVGRRQLDLAGGDAAVSHRRHGLAAGRADQRRHQRAGARDRAQGAAGHDGARAHHQRLPGADRAADAVPDPGRRRPRLVGAALDRLRRLVDHHDRAQDGAARRSAARCTRCTE